MLAAPASGRAAEAADLVLVNGHIYTDNAGWSSAMAVRRGVIVAMGDEAAVASLRGPATRTIDLKGDTVLPGFHDMHVHVTRGGRQAIECPIERGAPPARIREIISACAARLKPGEWITGRGWDNAVFVNQTQDKTLLDQAAPANPVFVQDETGHSGWANSLAMKLAGIDRTTKNPLNGIIEHYPNGEPNGLFREQGSARIRAIIPPMTEAQKLVSIDRALNEMAAVGITSLQDAGVNDEDSLPAFAELYDQGKLKLRVKACMRWRNDISGVDQHFETLFAQRNLYYRPKLNPDCVKLGLDGVPGDGHTAAMLEPYTPIPGDVDDSRKYGILTVPPDLLKTIMIRFDKAGLSTLSHCTGDRCAREALNAVEAARQANGYSGVMHQIGHSNFNTSVDLKRAPALGVSFEYSAYLYYWNAVTTTYSRAVGMRRFARFKPLRESIDAGANTIEGSDWPVSPSVNPWIAVETLVTRERPGGGGEKLAAPQAITLKEAIDIYTINGARQFGHANEVGLLKPGYLADMIVLDRDPFAAPIATVHDTKVKMTFVGGELVQQAP